MSWPSVVETGGDVGRDLQAVDWPSTALGSPSRWPAGLLNVLQLMLASRFSMWMAWGPELTFFCNDAYRRDTLGSKYPWALGRPASEVWGEIWDDIGPRIESVLSTGAATWDESLRLYLERSGYREETYHTFSYSPLADEAGAIVGMLCVVAEETDKVIAERRLRTLRDVAAELTAADDQEAVFGRLATTLERDRVDLPFTLAYLSEDGNGTARLVATTGVPPDHRAAAADDGQHGWPSMTDGAATNHVARSDFPPWVQRLGEVLGDEMPEQALAVPLCGQPDLPPIGFFVAGLTPHRPGDDNIVSFVRLLTDQVDSAIKTVRALEAAQLRADTLAELDRVKTQFFANISHEFRTPLTLILGPLDRLRAAIAGAVTDDVAADVDTMHANALRLGKLVTDVLDFSRLQAGKLLPASEPVDLAGFTRELAEMFRPTIEQVGLRLVVHIDDTGPIEVDRSMWERIVLNLLSNAMKFTFEGEIGVTLAERDDQVVLTVSDTGVGVPERDLPRLFERFHRVERSRARSSEGTGIGLALVAELVTLHGGEVAVESTVDVGTTFTVSIPIRRPIDGAHRPIADGGARPAPAAYLAESARWVSDHDRAAGTRSPGDRATDRDGVEGRAASEGDVLVVDDNADMRAYLVRLLSPRFRVRTATNGVEALESIAAHPPDLLVSDVMMPHVDGVELVRRVRGDPSLAELPVILLTAAAGSSDTAQGLDVGADDYLVKPFTAENLLVRVSSRLAAGTERRRRSALRELSAAVAARTVPEDVLRDVQPFLATWLGVGAASLAVVEDAIGTVRLWHEPGYPGGVTERYRTGTTSGAAPIFRSIREGDTILMASLDEIATGAPDILADCRTAGVEALATLPLRTPTGAVKGGFACTWPTQRTLTPAELALLDATARVVADAVDHISAVADEHRFLSEFQERLLEIDQRSTTAVVSVGYRPAQGTALVGGDWYDIITLADGSLGISIGDVVGSGLSAATSMSQLRSAARLAAMSNDGADHVLTMLDEFTRRSRTARCASAVYARLRPDGRLTWCSAGHPPPLLIAGTDVRFLTGGLRPLLGCALDTDAGEATTSVPPGATLLLYTDGLVERRGESIDVGLERLAEAAIANRHLSVGRLNDELIRLLAPPDGLRDDVALIAVRTTGRERAHYVDAFHSDPAELAPARRRFRGWLTALDAQPGVVDDTMLAFGEAVANAVEHGNRNDGTRVVGVEAAQVFGGHIDVSVTDNGHWASDPAQSQRRGRGRGFGIMDIVSGDLDVTTSRTGTTVTFSVLAGNSPGA